MTSYVLVHGAWGGATVGEGSGLCSPPLGTRPPPCDRVGECPPFRHAGSLRFGVCASIKALDDDRDGSPLWPIAERVRDDPAWRYHEIDSNHMIPENRPTQLVEILLALG